MEVSKQIIEVLDYICEKIGLAIDWTAVFASENVIPYIEQLCRKFITYEIATSVATMILFVIVIIAGIILAKLIHNNKEFGVTHYHTISDDYFVRYLCYALLGFMCFIATLILSREAYEIIKCVTFPEMVIFEELMHVYENLNSQ